MKELESGEVRAVKVVEEEDFIVHDDKVDVLVAFHEDEGRLLGHDIVNDALNTLLVLLQDLGADRALD